MRVAILETGRPPGGLAERFGDYPAMISRLLGPGFTTERFDVQAGQLPAPGDHEGLLISGSPAGVYEPLQWIAPLCAFIRSAASTPMVGLCFGHQAMAQALGGQVEKSDKGWGIGLHRYAIVHREPWMDGGDDRIAVPVSHQDQVIARPPGTRAIACSSFTPFAALAWQDRPAISFQFHPEFSPDFAKALIERRRDRLPDPDSAIASLDEPGDSDRVASWIRRFLKETR